MEQQEIWKDIEGYEGKYQVSNMGRVRSLGREVYHGRFHKFQKERVLRGNLLPQGYYQVLLSKNGRPKPFRIHRLVAMAFVEGYKEGLVVNHKNEIKADNRAENLEWVTQQQNVNCGTVIERRVDAYSTIVEQRTKDGALVATYKNTVEAAKATGFNASNIGDCCRDERKTHHGFKWNYKDKRVKKAKPIKKQKGVRVDLEGEVWKDVKGYEGLYQVSNLGRVWIVTSGMFRKTRKLFGHSVGVTLYGKDKGQNYGLARLVAMHFVPGYREGLIVMFKNKDYTDCRASNLEWCTFSQKIQRTYWKGFPQLAYTMKHEKPVEQYTLDGEFIAEYKSCVVAAAKMEVNPVSIAAAARGVQKTSCGYIWRYKNSSNP